MITKSTNRSGERREQNLRIHEDRMDLLGTIHEMIEAEFARREEGQWGSKPQPRAPSAYEQGAWGYHLRAEQATATSAIRSKAFGACSQASSLQWLSFATI